MRRIFADRRRQTSAAGIVALWAGAIVETLANASRVHFDLLRQDLAYTVRVGRRSPGFALMAMAIVALGIGATTAAFSVTDFVLIRPLPFPDPSRLVQVWESTPGYTQMELSPPNYRDWKAAARSFESMGGYYTRPATVVIANEPERVPGAFVTADLLPTLGVGPVIGRAFGVDDDRPGAPGTLLLSYRMWQTSFGGDPDIVGRRLAVDGESCTVVGIMPHDFHFPDNEIDLWLPARFNATQMADDERADNYVHGVARLRPGVALAQASAELGVIADRLERQFPKENADTGAAVFALADQVSERSRLLLVALSAAAACLLLIACANLANLLLARAIGRRRELAVRAAMGAGRERLVRQLLTESLLLAAIGGVIGVAIASVSVPLLARLVPQSLPVAAAPSIDLRVLAIAAVLTVVTGLAFGLVPVLRTSAGPDVDGLREGVRAGGGRRERLRSALVVAEVAASVALLASAGLLIRALVTIRGVDPGFAPEGVLSLRAELPESRYETVAARTAFYDRVIEQVRALPGVTSAGFISFLPMSSFRGGVWPVEVPGDASAGAIRSANNVASIRYVTPGYFRTMRIPIVRGRDVSDTDGQDRQGVAVVSDSFVRRYWPGEDAIGRHFTFAFADREVVGVVGDVRVRGLERVSEPQVYLSSKQVPDGQIVFYAPRALVIRATGSPAALASPARAIIRGIDSSVPIADVQTLPDLVDLDTSSRAVQVRVLAGFAILAFGLAAIGIHGLLSFAVSQRVNEIGVRVALGARSVDILMMVVSRGALLALAGVLPGILLAYAAGRSMQALLAGVPPADTISLAGAIAFALVMTIVGTLAPTLRALRVDPVTALRSE